MMRKLLPFLLILSLSASFAQINDQIRTGASQKSNSGRTSKSSSSSSGSSSSSSGGSSSGDIALLINMCSCLYSTAIPFFSEVVVKAVQNNTDFVQGNHDSLRRIKNIEVNVGYGAYPDKDVVYFPRVRMQAGYIGTSFRAQAIQDKSNPFLTDITAFYDWQMMEFNYINTKHFTMRSGFGFLYFANTSGSKPILSLDLGTSVDYVFRDEQFRASMEVRVTPFDDLRFLSKEGVEFKKEIGARLYYRPSPDKRFKPEIFGGGYYQRILDTANLWKLEAGVGFMLY
jgi:hypothetical protein